MSGRALLLILLALAAGLYGWLDVRQRARIDRGVRKHRTDFTVYQYAARALVRGEDPYEAVNPRGYRYVYPPFLAVLLMPIAGFDPANAATLWFALSMLAFAAALWGLSGWPAAGGSVGRRAVLIAAFGIGVGFAHQGFQRGQVTHLLLCLQVFALTAFLGRRHALCGVLLALAAALRLTPLLPAAVVGLHLLARLRKDGFAPTLRFSAGLGGGLLVGFVLVPLVALGAERARDVSARWLDVTTAVYGAAPGELADLEERYKINEYRFKNQAPRRVFATWTGWATGAEFERERPALTAGAWVGVDRAARVLAWAVLALAMLAAVLRRDVGADRFTVLYAVVVLAPVLVTRYAWPTHFLMALPLLALALAARHTAAVAVFFSGTALFYAAHAEPLEWIGQAGCLLLATVWLLLRESRAAAAVP